MAAIADIVINDGQTTPVGHTFAATDVSRDGIARWQERTTNTVPVGYFEATASIRRPGKGASTTKVDLKVVCPTLEVTAGSTGGGYQAAPKLAYNCLAVCSFVMHERSTLQNRKDILAYMRNFLNATAVVNMVQDGTGIW